MTDFLEQYHAAVFAVHVERVIKPEVVGREHGIEEVVAVAQCTVFAEEVVAGAGLHLEEFLFRRDEVQGVEGQGDVGFHAG